MFFRLSAPSSSNTKIEPIPHMIAHWSGDAETARRTFGLEPCRHIHYISVYVSPVGNRVAHVDANPKADGPISRLVTIVDGHLLLDLDRTAHRSLSAVEHQKERITTCVDEPATMLVNRRVYQASAERPQPLQRPNVVQADQPRVTDHVCIQHGDQPPPILRPSGRVRSAALRHGAQPYDRDVTGHFGNRRVTDCATAPGVQDTRTQEVLPCIDQCTATTGQLLSTARYRGYASAAAMGNLN